MNTTRGNFPTEIEGLPEAQPPELIELSDGDRFDLRIAPVAERLGDATVRMLAYNGSIPGPTLKVQEGSELIVDIDNQADMKATVHWHGLRLENRYDGTHETQTPIQVGERYSARVTFPDPGVYWYHPHIREDYGQEMGLYANVLVEPADPDYWPPAHRELPLTLDDILLEDGKVAPFSRAETTYAAMGRFGDVLLVNGQTDLALDAKLGEVIRFYLTNTANTRVFKVALPGARMKLFGGDSGHVENEEFVDDVVLAPSERVVIDVLFDQAGDLVLEHHTPDRTYPPCRSPRGRAARRAFARRAVRGPAHEPRHGRATGTDRPVSGRRTRQDGGLPRRDGHGRAGSRGGGRIRVPGAPAGSQRGAGPLPPVRHEAAGRRGSRHHHLRLPDAPRGCQPSTGPLPRVRHEAAAGEPGRRGRRRSGGTRPRPRLPSPRPRGPRARPRGTRSRPRHGGRDRVGGRHGRGQPHDDPANMRWKIIDRETGAENTAIDWRFRVGDRIKIRLLNEMAGDHPMHHPFHVHGAGRFLVLSRDEVTEPNLVWKDTVLVRAGETVDILLDVTNVGRWMAHCTSPSTTRAA
jgi:FtsP/CotA-like multicopper oxidase with cupredoxin domain